MIAIIKAENPNGLQVGNDEQGYTQLTANEYEQEIERMACIRLEEEAEQKQVKEAKEFGFSDLQLARLLNQTENIIRKWRIELGIKPDYKLVDTCAGEFEAFTPYFYSTYE